MGDLLPFRRRRKTWTRPEDYARRDWGRVLPASTWRGTRPRRRSGAWRAARWWVALALLAGLWVLWRDAIAFDPPAFLEGEPVKVAGRFTRCGAGPAQLCVVDGDTLKVGARRVRIVGIDAPELDARCTAEALGADRAAQGLLGWVNRGPFELVPRLDQPTDKYGRALMTARRVGLGGVETAAEYLVVNRLARPYRGEARQSWC